MRVLAFNELCTGSVANEIVVKFALTWASEFLRDCRSTRFFIELSAFKVHRRRREGISAGQTSIFTGSVCYSHSRLISSHCSRNLLLSPTRLP